jgi:TolB-like protein
VRLTILNTALSFLIFCLAASCAALPKGASKEDIPQIRKLAVLPFDNITGSKNAGLIVASIYVTELFKTGRFLIEEPGNIRQFMIQEHIDTIGEVELDRLKVLGRRLGVDAVVVGTVEEFDEGMRNGVPIVSITARMVTSASGRVIWSAQNKRRGDDYTMAFEFGEVRTATALTERVVREMIGTLNW